MIGARFFALVRAFINPRTYQKEVISMKLLKALILILLSLTIVFSLSACSDGDNTCTEHIDANEDGICDTEGCGATVEPAPQEDIVLIENGVANFQIVLAGDAPDGEILNAAESLVAAFTKLGIEVNLVYEDAEPTDCEILIGGVENRGERYYVDGHDYGLEGYGITMSGKKVIIAGGSVYSTVKAINSLKKDIFKIKSTTKSLDNVTMKTDDVITDFQNDYYTQSIKFGDNDIKGYVIVTDKDNKYQNEAALLLQTRLYEEAGYWLPIVNEAAADGKMIIFSNADKDSTPSDSFRITLEGNTLKVVSEYENSYENGVDDFYTNKITRAEANVVLENGFSYNLDVSVVYYTDFGAVGDGKTNDFKALVLAHEFANISGQTVKGAKSGEGVKKYYIKDTRISGRGTSVITIMTNVDWNNTHFIIDDTTYGVDDGTKLYSHPIFRVASPYEEITLTGDDIKNFQNVGPETTKIDLGLGYPAMLIVTNKEHRVYIRYGPNANSGDLQEEIILIDAEGNVVKGTELMLSYEKVTSITVIRTDVDPITIEGGTITRWATRSQTDRNTYFKRNLQVIRSNTTIKGVKQYNEKEFTVEEQAAGKRAAPYTGFFWAYKAHNIVFEECVMTAPRYYGGGTYGFSAGFSNDVLLLNCTQSNFYKKDSNGNLTDIPSTEKSAITGQREYWGIGGSSFCKNLVFDGCMLTRYDAHAGVYNGKILNSTIVMINLIGGGDMLIENTEIIMEGSTLINLRNDYGSTWKGTITIKDCSLMPYDKSKTELYILGQKWVNHYFGYTCYMPNVVVDNLSFAKNATAVPVYLVSTATNGYDSIYSETKLHQSITSSGVKNLNPLAPAEYLKVINNKANLDFRIYDAPILTNIELITDDTCEITHKTYGK